ncbi:hypothetical protein EXE46_07050 [Halorubrum sp. GN11_10-6_MGM]|uniref:hypothetical protein n=1 Tax=Halorubrum sp. GN11_10-6_MGM TaxID=2518112 RepID=UPI0010FA370B|nr:hypothetical protein [Halorubrum sp. GN11_10-6_MGM]TKX74786.1 hypothetical protein EXE46_07050 [Halorubrum sp. GN11_10-6_MGM]
MGPRRLSLVAALLLCVTVIVAAPPVDARAPPTPVCGVCDLDRTTADGTSVVAGESSLAVTLHENGSTTWDARVALASGGDALASNESLRRAVVADAVRDGIAEPTNVTARVDGGVLSVDYRDPTAAERYLGTVVFTPLTPASPRNPLVIGGEGARYLATDSLTVRGASGWEVHGDAPVADATGGLVWTPESAGPDADERVPLEVERDPVAVEERALLPGVRAWIARLLTGNSL